MTNVEHITAQLLPALDPKRKLAPLEWRAIVTQLQSVQDAFITTETVRFLLEEIGRSMNSLLPIVMDLKIVPNTATSFAYITKDGVLSFNPHGAYLYSRSAIQQNVVEQNALRLYIILVLYLLSKGEDAAKAIEELQQAIKREFDKGTADVERFIAWLSEYLNARVPAEVYEVADRITIYGVIPLLLHEVMHLALDHFVRFEQMLKDLGIDLKSIDPVLRESLANAANYVFDAEVNNVVDFFLKQTRAFSALGRKDTYEISFYKSIEDKVISILPYSFSGIISKLREHIPVSLPLSAVDMNSVCSAFGISSTNPQNLIFEDVFPAVCARVLEVYERMKSSEEKEIEASMGKEGSAGESQGAGLYDEETFKEWLRKLVEQIFSQNPFENFIEIIDLFEKTLPLKTKREILADRLFDFGDRQFRELFNPNDRVDSVLLKAVFYRRQFYRELIDYLNVLKEHVENGDLSPEVLNSIRDVLKEEKIDEIIQSLYGAEELDEDALHTLKAEKIEEFIRSLNSIEEVIAFVEDRLHIADTLATIPEFRSVIEEIRSKIAASAKTIDTILSRTNLSRRVAEYEEKLKTAHQAYKEVSTQIMETSTRISDLIARRENAAFFALLESNEALSVLLKEASTLVRSNLQKDGGKHDDLVDAFVRLADSVNKINLIANAAPVALVESLKESENANVGTRETTQKNETDIGNGAKSQDEKEFTVNTVVKRVVDFLDEIIRDALKAYQRQQECGGAHKVRRLLVRVGIPIDNLHNDIRAEKSDDAEQKNSRRHEVRRELATDVERYLIEKNPGGQDQGRGMGGAIEKLLYPEKQNEQLNLARLVRKVIGIATEVGVGRSTNTNPIWFPPSSIARATGLLIPSREELRTTFGIIIDTSGSISSEMLNAAGTILFNTARAFGELRVIMWDDGLQLDKVVRNPRKDLPAAYGRGGTSMESAIDYFIANYGKTGAGIFVLTDGLTNWKDYIIPRVVPIIVVDIMSFTKDGTAPRPPHPHYLIRFVHEPNAASPRPVLEAPPKDVMRAFISKEKKRMHDKKVIMAIEEYKNVATRYHASVANQKDRYVGLSH